MRTEEPCRLCITRMTSNKDGESIRIRVDTDEAVYDVDIGLADFAAALTARYTEGGMLTVFRRKQREVRP